MGKKKEQKIDPHSVFEGILLLTPTDKNEKGYLYAKEVAKMKLQADLVSMSACYSGVGRKQQEGSISLVWAFHAAGAVLILATYWPLYDTESTVDTMEAFYKCLIANTKEHTNGLRKERALQSALIMAIEKARRNPDEWGALFLSGLG